MRHRKVVVVGGGLAGLTAACALVERRFDVTLVERRGILGGRASSSRDSVTGDVVDNGTHLMIGAYTELFALLRRVGADSLLLAQDDLSLEWIDGLSRSRLRCPPLVAPLHLLVGLLGLRIPLGAKLEAMRFGFAALRGGPRLDETLAEWFGRTGQGSEVRALLWDPLVLATMNETPERVSASLFHRVFREAFLQDHRFSRLVFLKAGWSEVAECIAHHVEARGGRVFRRCRAERVTMEDGRASGVSVSMAAQGRDAVAGGAPSTSGQIDAEAVVLAVPWHAVPALLPDELRGQSPFADLSALGGSSIVSVELWLDRAVVEAPMLGFRGGEFDWVFDKGRLHGRCGLPQHLSLVTSAAARIASLSNADLVAAALRALRQAFPEAEGVAVARSLVLRDPRATFAATPNAERLRPNAGTSTRGLYLAGDWTATGLPATLEGAVRSGQAAAAAVAADSSPGSASI